MPHLGRHGDRVELMMTPERTSAGLELPHEMHVLSFANERGWVNYRGDPQVTALAPLRDKSVSKAIFLKGTRPPARTVLAQGATQRRILVLVGQ